MFEYDVLYFHFTVQSREDVLALCIVNDGPEATFSILGHRSNNVQILLNMYGWPLASYEKTALL